VKPGSSPKTHSKILKSAFIRVDFGMGIRAQVKREVPLDVIGKKPTKH